MGSLVVLHEAADHHPRRRRHGDARRDESGREGALRQIHPVERDRRFEVHSVRHFHPSAADARFVFVRCKRPPAEREFPETRR